MWGLRNQVPEQYSTTFAGGKQFVECGIFYVDAGATLGHRATPCCKRGFGSLEWPV